LRVKVFIQNEAGSDQNHVHDEKTLTYQRTDTVSRPYPFPYGFILDTTSQDGDNLDCYVITQRPLKTGTIVACEVVALFEQTEDGEEDHNILATVPGETQEIGSSVVDTLRKFISHVFEHIPDKQMTTGRLLSKAAAQVHIRECSQKN
jgi:inorganic pyrophosphatase